MSDDVNRELPAGWELTTIGEIAVVNPGKSITRELPDYTDVTFVPMSAVEEVQGTIASPQNAKLREVQKGYTCFADGDVIFAKITPCMENGKAAIVRNMRNGIGFGSTEFHVIRPKDGLLPEWVYYYVRQAEYRRQAKANFSGTAGQLRVPRSFVELSPIPLAPLNEQRRIVAKIEELLTRLDAGVVALKRTQANLKRYKASVLKAACEGWLVSTEAELARAEGRSYEPASLLLERILAERRAKWEADLRAKGKYIEPQPPDTSGLPALREGWCWTNIDSICGLIQYGTSEKADASENEVPVLRMGNIKDGDVEYSALKYIRSTTIGIRNLVLSRGDLLFNRTNSAELVGKTAVFKGYSTDLTFASYLIRVQLMNGCVPEFAAFYINSLFGRRYIATVVSQQVGQANVNGTKLGQMPIPLPPWLSNTELLMKWSAVCRSTRMWLPLLRPP